MVVLVAQSNVPDQTFRLGLVSSAVLVLVLVGRLPSLRIV